MQPAQVGSIIQAMFGAYQMKLWLYGQNHACLVSLFAPQQGDGGLIDKQLERLQDVLDESICVITKKFMHLFHMRKADIFLIVKYLRAIVNAKLKTYCPN